MYCPLCEDPQKSNSPSASINWTSEKFYCFSCAKGMGVRALMRQVKRNGNGHSKKPILETAKYNPFEAFTEADIVSLDKAREAKKNGIRIEQLSEAKVQRYVDHLLKETPARLDYLINRHLSKSTVEAYKIGYDAGRDRYTLPIYDADGTLVNIRRYAIAPPTGQPKMRNATGHGSPARLYPIHHLSNDTIIVCEGEWDALLSTQKGFPAITGTHGVGTWLPGWGKLFTGKLVYICFDNDKEGRIAAKKVARSLVRSGATVRIIHLPDVPEHGDLTDWWAKGTKQQFEALQETAEIAYDQTGPEDTDTPLAVPVQVVGSMDSTTNGRTLEMQVTITGKRNPTYSIPHKAKLVCTLDAGPKCKACPMYTEFEGEKDVTIERKDVDTISQFIDAGDDKVTEILRRYIGAVKCNRFEREEVQNQTVEELFITGSIDKRNTGGEADYTQRRIYNIGSHDTKTNVAATVVGTTVPNPKDRRNEFFSWELKEAITSIDKFVVTPAVVKRLKSFQPKGNQTPLQKCREIAEDFSANVTKIYGRERLHICIDLVFHSVLHFPLDGKIIGRGWLEFLVVGDTRTGKSETSGRLTDHYGLGHVIGCEGATLAGLVGAVKQVADAWTVQWGEITINDRRLVVLDEVSGLSTDVISQMSDIRSRGIAQLTKAEKSQTNARCRMVWISNPRRGRFVDEKKYEGIDVIEDLIGNPEDIARFDFAMSVRESDVLNDKINTTNRVEVQHKYTSELCRELVLWAWSRRPEQVEWYEDAYEAVYKAAKYLGSRYADTPPLIQAANVREKIARIAVALAARTFSTDGTGENVVVKLIHVREAMNFLDELYSYDNFGYMRLSERIRNNRKIARRNRNRIRHWLQENPRLLDFLIDRRGSFRAQDLEEMAHMQKDEVNHALSTLSDAKMISKQKSQIILEPELHALLRKLESERQ